MQLGNVSCYPEEAYRKEKDDARCKDNMGWTNSGYVLVVTIEPNGKAGIVWLLRDFRPYDDIDGTRYTIDESDGHLGYLRGGQTDEQRSVIKIADSMGSLRPDGEWSITAVSPRYELVAAVYHPLLEF
jgi:hypothetical protein